MKEVKIYSLENCTYCERAKALFRNRGVAFNEIKVDRNDSNQVSALVQKTGMKTFPQIFIGDQLVGGYSELEELELKGSLDSMLQGEATPKKAAGCGCH